MSQIATFRCVPDAVVAHVVSLASVPHSREAAKAAFWAMEYRFGPDVLDFGWSGYAVLVLVEYLRDECGFDFERVDGHPLAQLLTADGYCAVFEPDEAARMAARIARTPLDEIELRAYANDFSATDDRDAGKALLDGARALAAALGCVRTDCVGLLRVG